MGGPHGAADGVRRLGGTGGRRTWAADTLEVALGAADGAQERYAADPETVVQAAAERFPFPPAYIREYFSRLSYGFGRSERTGLTRFLELAQDAGELATVPRLAA